MPCLAVHVCMNSAKFVLKAPGASILWGRYYSVTMCRLIRWALLLGRALLIGTLRYFVKIASIYFISINSCQNVLPIHKVECKIILVPVDLNSLEIISFNQLV